MAMETVLRRWTIATWLVARGGDHLEAIANTLEPLRADAVALQSIGERDASTIAAAIGCNVAWELSHHPRSRLFPGSAIGLAVISPHTITQSASTVINDHPSTWSTKRRVVQVAQVDRHDATVYAISHQVGPARTFVGQSSAPHVAITPEQVGVDSSRAIALPDDATLVSHQVTTPVDGLEPMQATTFDMPWVKGDFPVL